MKPIKKAVLLHDLCGVGKAALTNMLPILGVMGIEACPVPTVLLSTHTGGYGVPSILHIPSDFIRACADHYKREQICFDAIFIGYIGDKDTIDAVSYFIRQFPDVLVVFDPIMGDHGKYYSNFDHSYLESLITLTAYADILLPNFTEFCFLAGIPFDMDCPKQELDKAVRTLHLKSQARIIVTSVPLECTQKNILTYENNIWDTHCLPTLPYEFHGSGDAFDGVFLGAYLNGASVTKAIHTAHDFVYQCILASAKEDYPAKEGLMIEKSLGLLV